MSKTLSNGHYRTAAGSKMRISGEFKGISEVSFDWVEEGGCLDCVVEVYEQEGWLVWHCTECGGGKAELKPATTISVNIRIWNEEKEERWVSKEIAGKSSQVIKNSGLAFVSQDEPEFYYSNKKDNWF